MAKLLFFVLGFVFAVTDNLFFIKEQQDNYFCMF